MTFTILPVRGCLSLSSQEDFEYFVSASPAGGEGEVVWPPGAGLSGGAQTVVVMQQ